MGVELEMYAYAAREKPAKAVDFNDPETSERLHHWRKHPNLHAWMEKLYFKKGGEDRFTMSPVTLDAADLDQLEAAIVQNQLPHDTSRFFSGGSDGSEHGDDLMFIGKARAALAAGKTVFYVAFW